MHRVVALSSVAQPQRLLRWWYSSPLLLTCNRCNSSSTNDGGASSRPHRDLHTPSLAFDAFLSHVALQPKASSFVTRLTQQIQGNASLLTLPQCIRLLEWWMCPETPVLHSMPCVASHHTASSCPPTSSSVDELVEQAATSRSLGTALESVIITHVLVAWLLRRDDGEAEGMGESTADFVWLRCSALLAAYLHKTESTASSSLYSFVTTEMIVPLISAHIERRGDRTLSIKGAALQLLEKDATRKEEGNRWCAVKFRTLTAALRCWMVLYYQGSAKIPFYMQRAVAQEFAQSLAMFTACVGELKVTDCVIACDSHLLSVKKAVHAVACVTECLACTGLRSLHLLKDSDCVSCRVCKEKALLGWRLLKMIEKSTWPSCRNVGRHSAVPPPCTEVECAVLLSRLTRVFHTLAVQMVTLFSDVDVGWSQLYSPFTDLICRYNVAISGFCKLLSHESIWRVVMQRCHAPPETLRARTDSPLVLLVRLADIVKVASNSPQRGVHPDTEWAERQCNLRGNILQAMCTALYRLGQSRDGDILGNGREVQTFLFVFCRVWDSWTHQLPAAVLNELHGSLRPLIDCTTPQRRKPLGVHVTAWLTLAWRNAWASDRPTTLGHDELMPLMCVLTEMLANRRRGDFVSERRRRCENAKLLPHACLSVPAEVLEYTLLGMCAKQLENMVRHPEAVRQFRLPPGFGASDQVRDRDALANAVSSQDFSLFVALGTYTAVVSEILQEGTTLSQGGIASSRLKHLLQRIREWWLCSLLSSPLQELQKVLRCAMDKFHHYAYLEGVAPGPLTAALLECGSALGQVAIGCSDRSAASPLILTFGPLPIHSSASCSSDTLAKSIYVWDHSISTRIAEPRVRALHAAEMRGNPSSASRFRDTRKVVMECLYTILLGKLGSASAFKDEDRLITTRMERRGRRSSAPCLTTTKDDSWHGVLIGSNGVMEHQAHVFGLMHAELKAWSEAAAIRILCSLEGTRGCPSGCADDPWKSIFNSLAVQFPLLFRSEILKWLSEWGSALTHAMQGDGTRRGDLIAPPPLLCCQILRLLLCCPGEVFYAVPTDAVRSMWRCLACALREVLKVTRDAAHDRCAAWGSRMYTHPIPFAAAAEVLALSHRYLTLAESLGETASWALHMHQRQQSCRGDAVSALLSPFTILAYHAARREHHFLVNDPRLEYADAVTVPAPLEASEEVLEHYIRLENLISSSQKANKTGSFAAEREKTLSLIQKQFAILTM